MPSPLTSAEYERCFRIYALGGHLLSPYEAALRANVPRETWLHFRDERRTAGLAEREATRIRHIPEERRGVMRCPSRINYEAKRAA